MPRGFGDYVNDAWRNWKTYDGPLIKKLGLAIRNRAIATTFIRGGCCGHVGEPGC
ncbi:MAG TPA: hypothetical protein VE754_00400 [Actinomycetota bacterium]|jgi:hypothetical protein|nr:hypothetical protein [Actinomycetota bacterium]